MKSIWYAFQGTVSSHIFLTLARPTFQIVIILQPIVLATISYMLYKRSGQIEDFATFVVLGSGIAGVWSGIVFSSAGDIDRERSYRTLSVLVSAPTELFVTMFGKIVANGILSTFSLLVSILFSVWILGVPFSIAHPIEFVAALILFLVSTNLFALTLSAIFFTTVQN